MHGLYRMIGNLLLPVHLSTAYVPKANNTNDFTASINTLYTWYMYGRTVACGIMP